MSVISVYPSVNHYIGNPAVEQARRENLKRDIIEPVAASERGNAEKGVILEDKSRQLAQQQALIYGEDGKQRGTELKQAIEGREQQGDSQQQQSSGQHQDEQAPSSGKSMAASDAELVAEQAQIAELKDRDAEVKAHEQAHAAVGGQLASAPTYSYQTGPDGRKYAVGGEVQIDISPVPGDPNATIIKMQQVKAAALAPAEPSGADRQVAAEASRVMLEAQAALAKEALDIETTVASRDDASEDISFEEMTGRIDLPVTELFPDSSAFNVDVAAGKQNDEPTTSSVWQTQMQGNGSDSEQQNEAMQRRTLAVDPAMQIRSDVIAGFYARATMPIERPLLQRV